MAITNQLCCSMRQPHTWHQPYRVHGASNHAYHCRHAPRHSHLHQPLFSFFKVALECPKATVTLFSCNGPNKVFYPFTLGSKGNLIQQTIGSFLPSPEFFHTWILHIRWVLSSLVFFCKIRSLQNKSRESWLLLLLCIVHRYFPLLPKVVRKRKSRS